MTCGCSGGCRIRCTASSPRRPGRLCEGVHGGEPVITDREEELMRLMAVQGATLGEAAKRMYISESTAQRHRNNVVKKLGARTTPHAVYLWLCARASEQTKGRKR